MNLTEFAKTRRTTNCVVCDLLDLEEIEAAWLNGIRAQVIEKWLKEHKKVIDVSRHQIARHFDQSHHLKETE